VFSSITPTTGEVATMETANETAERGEFLKYDDVRKVNFALFDNTNSGATKYAVRLTGTANETYGLARSLQVMPGDKVKAEVYAKYLDPTSSNWTAAVTNLVSSVINGTATSGTVVDGAAYGTTGGNSIPFAGVLSHGSETGSAPKAYLNWLVFDKNFVFVPGKSGFKRMTEAAKENGTLAPEGVAHELLDMPEINITEPGYVYIYFSNENGSPIEVYFDDFKVTHTKTNVVQYNEYYPFGEATENSWTRENTSNNYLYNAGSERNATTGNYEMFFREYDPLLGRMNAVDPMTEKYASLTPYNYAFNDPVYWSDVSGADPANPGFNDAAWSFIMSFWNHATGENGGKYGTSWSWSEGYTYHNDWNSAISAGIDYNKDHNTGFGATEFSWQEAGKGIDKGSQTEYLQYKKVPKGFNKETGFRFFRVENYDPGEPTLLHKNEKGIDGKNRWGSRATDGKVNYEESLDFSLFDGKIDFILFKEDDRFFPSPAKYEVDFDKNTNLIYGRLGDTSFSIAVRDGNFITTISGSSAKMPSPLRTTGDEVRILMSTSPRFRPAETQIIGFKPVGVNATTTFRSTPLGPKK
jgi:RHS repeat-associated protein